MDESSTLFPNAFRASRRQRLPSGGAKVVLGARRTDRLEKIVAELKGRGLTAAAHPLDVTDLAQMREVARFAQETFGRVDVVVNNAGVMPLSKMEALKVEEWDRMIDVNIRGVLHGIAAGFPVMKRQGSGQAGDTGSAIDRAK